MKQINGVWNIFHDGTVQIDIGNSTDESKTYTFDIGTPARYWIFRLLTVFLDRETINKQGFFRHTGNGWFWLRFSEAR